MGTKVTILGSGTSTGVPIIGCPCKVCRSKNPKNKRLRASVWFQKNKKSILVDSSTDFRTQALTYKIARIDAVLLTHSHADHISGLDDLRCYNFIQKSVIPIYGNLHAKKDLFQRFSYVFNPGIVEGGGIPKLDFKLVSEKTSSFKAAGIKVIPLPADHGSRLRTLGFRIDDIAYLTDCSYIPPLSLNRMRDLSVLILDCVRLKPHRTHLNLDRALEVISQVKPRKTYLTHLGHDFDYSIWNRKLPRQVRLAYDGLSITT